MWAALAIIVLAAGDGDARLRRLTLELTAPQVTDAGVDFELRATFPLVSEATWNQPEVKRSVDELEKLAGACGVKLELPSTPPPKLSLRVGPVEPGRITWKGHFDGLAAQPMEWSAQVKCGPLDSGAEPWRFGVLGAPTNAFAVILWGSKSEADTSAWLTSWLSRRQAQTWNEFPKQFDSRWVLGLTPGFSVVIGGLFEDEATAKLFAKELNENAEGKAYVKPVWWPTRHDARLFVIEQVVDDNRVLSDENEIFLLQQGMPFEEGVRGRSLVWPSGRAVVVYTLGAAGKPSVEIAVSAPQTSCKARAPKGAVAVGDKPVFKLKQHRISCEQGD